MQIFHLDYFFHARSEALKTPHIFRSTFCLNTDCAIICIAGAWLLLLGVFERNLNNAPTVGIKPMTSQLLGGNHATATWLPNVQIYIYIV